MENSHRMIVGLALGIPGLLLTALLFQTDQERENGRKKPFYVETVPLSEVLVHGFEDMKSARKFAVSQTVGIYHLNGRLNNKRADIFENRDLVETYISGLPEEEYNKIKAEHESEDKGNTEVRSVTSFGWNLPSKKV